MRTPPLLLAVACLLGACTTVHDSVSDVNETVLGSGVDSKMLIPDRTIGVSPSITFPLEKVVYWGMYAAVAYLILDPFAPNWEIEEARLGDNYVHFNLKMKRYYSGGAGEARYVVQQRAKTLVRKGGFKSYEMIEYNEGIESSMLGSKRTTQAVIKLIPKA